VATEHRMRCSVSAPIWVTGFRFRSGLYVIGPEPEAEVRLVKISMNRENAEEDEGIDGERSGGVEAPEADPCS
jgi:hypothetical protein